jgi:hypothetical protein
MRNIIFYMPGIKIIKITDPKPKMDSRTPINNITVIVNQLRDITHLFRIIQDDKNTAEAFDAWLGNYPSIETRSDVEEFYMDLDELLDEAGLINTFKLAITHSSPQLQTLLRKDSELLTFLNETLPLKIDNLKQVQKDYEKFLADTQEAEKPLQEVIKKITVLRTSFVSPLTSEKQKAGLNNWLIHGDGSMFLGMVTDFSRKLATLLKDNDKEEEYYDALERLLFGSTTLMMTFLKTCIPIFDFLSSTFESQYPALLEMNAAYLKHLQAVKQKANKTTRTHPSFAEFKNTLFRTNDTAAPPLICGTEIDFSTSNAP